MNPGIITWTSVRSLTDPLPDETEILLLATSDGYRLGFLRHVTTITGAKVPVKWETYGSRSESSPTVWAYCVLPRQDWGTT